MLGLDHPAFAPLWRRIAIVLALVIWTVVELIFGASAWAALCAGLALYCSWVFFLSSAFKDKSGN